MGASMHVLPVQIYYEDTDHSGRVYYANYLKYFERAREHMLGVDELVRLWRDEGVGFVVYRCDVTYKQGAVHGDTVLVKSSARMDSAYRLAFQQDVWRGDELLVHGVVQLVCVDRDAQLVQLPAALLARLALD
jgi:tol-pal system-associated acyl-CoA thioesterase